MSNSNLSRLTIRSNDSNITNFLSYTTDAKINIVANRNNINSNNISIGCSSSDKEGFISVNDNKILSFQNNSNCIINSHFIPASNETYDLGTSNTRWKDLYLSGNTIYLGDAVRLSVDTETSTLSVKNRNNQQTDFSSKNLKFTDFINNTSSNELEYLKGVTSPIQQHFVNVSNYISTKSTGSGDGSSQWTTSNNNIYYNLGNVGIGSIIPTEKIDIIGNIKFTGSINNITSNELNSLLGIKSNIQTQLNTSNTWITTLDSNQSNNVIQTSNQIINTIKNLNLSPWTSNTEYISYSNIQVYPNEIKIYNPSGNTITPYIQYNFTEDPVTSQPTSTLINYGSSGTTMNASVYNANTSNITGQYPFNSLENLIVWYKFDNNSTDMLLDSSGNNYNCSNVGTVFNNITYIRGNGSIYLNGSAYINISDNFNLYNTWNNNGLSLSLWINYINVNTFPAIFGFSDSSTNSQYLIRAYVESNLSIRLQLLFSPLSINQSYWIPSGNFKLNAWNHYVFTINSSGVIILYLNNIQYNTNITLLIPNINFVVKYIGRSGYSSDTLFPTGYIDDFRIYNKVLTANEVKQIMGFTINRQQGRLANTYAYYWNGLTVNNTYDNAYIELPKNTIDPIITSKAITVATWIKNDNLNNQYPLYQMQKNASNFYIEILQSITGNTTGTRLIFSTGSIVTTYTTIWNSINEINKWIHYAYILKFDSSLNKVFVKLYKNGVLQTAASGGEFSISGFSFLASEAGSYARIGNNNNTTDLSPSYIQDFRIYNQELSVAQIRYLADVDQPVPTYTKLIDNVYITNTSNELISVILNSQLNSSNYTTTSSNVISNRITSFDTNQSNYISSTSNNISNRITNLTADQIVNGTNNKYIVNNTYNNNLTVNGTLTASNLSVIGNLTNISTVNYQTENVEIISQSSDGPAMKLTQYGSCNLIDIFDTTSNVFTIIKGGNVGIGSTTPTQKLDIIGNIKFTGSINNITSNQLGYLSGSIGNIQEQFVNVYSNISNSITTSSNLLINHVGYTSNILVNNIREFTTITSNTLVNTINNTSNYVDEKYTILNSSIALTQSTFQGNLTLTSNAISNHITNLNTDNIQESASRKYITNNIYSNDLTVSNLNVIGNIIPSMNSVFDIGASNNTIKDIYLSSNSSIKFYINPSSNYSELKSVNNNLNFITYNQSGNIIKNINISELSYEYIDYYASYQFNNQALLEVDSSSNNRSLTNTRGIYVLDQNRNSILFSNESLASLQYENWNNFSNLSLSFWFKTNNYNNINTLLNFEYELSDAYSNLVTWYRFNDNSNNMLLDSSGYKRTLTISGAPVFDTSLFKTGNGSLLLSASDFVTTSLSYNYGQNNAVSICMWFRFLNGYTSQVFTISTSGYSMTFICVNYSKSLLPSFTIQGTDILLTNGLSANVWYHIVFVLINTNEVKIYLNGSLNVSSTNKQYPINSTSYTTKIGIGYPGYVDDFRVYNRELTATEISKLYNITNTSTKNISIKNTNNALSFEVNNSSVYTYNLSNSNNTWNYVLWNITNNNNSQGFIRINNDKINVNKQTIFNNVYINQIGYLFNLANLYISDFKILTTPLTDIIESQLYNSTELSSIYNKIFNTDYFDNSINYINNRINVHSNLLLSGNGNVYFGNVGIGTTSIAAKLHINESTGTTAGANTGSIIIDHANSGGASSITFRSAVNRGSDYGYIQYQDSTTIGAAGESARLIIGTQNEADDHIVLLPSGNVGIGSTTPTQKLDIVGNIKVSGNFNSVTSVELGYLSGTTTSINTNFTNTSNWVAGLRDTKQNTITGTASSITTTNLTADRVMITDVSQKAAISSVTSAELGYLSGTTANINTNFTNTSNWVAGLRDTKQNTITGTASSITTTNLTADRVMITDVSQKAAISAVTSTELGYLSGTAKSINTNFIDTSNWVAGLRDTTTINFTNTSNWVAGLRDTKQNTITGTASSITTTNLTADRVMITDVSQKAAISSVTSTELGYLSGVTANINTNFINTSNWVAGLRDTKQNTITGTASSITTTNLTADRVMITDVSQKAAISAVTSTELGYLSGTTANINTNFTNTSNWVAGLRDTKQNTITGTASSITTTNLTADRVMITDVSQKAAISSVTSAELGYLSGTTKSINTNFIDTSNYINNINSRLTTLNSDQLIIGSSNKFIVNNQYNNPLTVNDTLTASNLNIIGTTTFINTTTYKTENLEINTAALDGPGLKVVQNGTQDIVQFIDSNDTVMIIRDGGNVGIGSSIPTEKLDIVGNIKVSGNFNSITSTELGYLAGTTININTNFTNTSNWVAGLRDTKQNNITGTASSITTTNLTADRVMITDGSQKAAVSSVTNVELGYLSGTTASINTNFINTSNWVAGLRDTTTVNFTNTSNWVAGLRDTKQNTITGTASSITTTNLTADRVMITDVSQKAAISAVTSTELGYLAGTTKSINTNFIDTSNWVAGLRDTKQNTITGTASSITTTNLTADRVMITDVSQKAAISSVTSTELGYLAGVTTSINTNFTNTSNWVAGLRDTKQNNITGTASSITTTNLTADRVMITDGSQKAAISAITSTELGYLAGTTKSINTNFIDTSNWVAGLRDTKQNTITGTASSITTTNLTADRVMITDVSQKAAISSVTSTELGYLSGTTANINTNFINTSNWVAGLRDMKQNNITGTASSITTTNLTADRVMITDVSQKAAISSVTSTELGYLAGTTKSINTNFIDTSNWIGSKQDIITLNNNIVVVSDGSGKIANSGITSNELSYLIGTQRNINTNFTNTSNWILSLATGGAASQWTTGTGLIYYNSGTVGIGKTNPNTSYKLDVTGDVYVEGAIFATGNITASFSDIRLKDIVGGIQDPLEKIMKINTFKYKPNQLATDLFICNKDAVQVGISAQDVREILPEVVSLAAFDTSNIEGGKICSKTGEEYLTVSYERMVPLLIECIKQLNEKVRVLESRL